MAADNAKNGAAPRFRSVEEILATTDTPEEVFYVAAWETHLRLKGLTKQQQVDIRTRSMRANDKGEMEPDPVETQKAMWLEGVVEPKFTEEHLGPLFQKSAGAVDDVLSRIMHLSGMDPEAIKRREAAFRKAPGV